MEDVRRAVAEAIRRVAARVQWKPGKDAAHLEKRKVMGHLPAEATLIEFDALIRSIVHDPRATVFTYRPAKQLFIAVRGDAAGREWLVIFSLDGRMETAFPPRDIDRYLARRGFTEIGTVEEVVG